MTITNISSMNMFRTSRIFFRYPQFVSSRVGRLVAPSVHASVLCTLQMAVTTAHSSKLFLSHWNVFCLKMFSSFGRAISNRPCKRCRPAVYLNSQICCSCYFCNKEKSALKTNRRICSPTV